MLRKSDSPRRRVRWALLAAASLAFLVAPSARAVTPEPLLTPANVTVDFGAEQGPLLRTERFNNFANPRSFPEQRPNDVAFLNQQGLHGDVYRVWMDDDAEEGTGFADLCDVTTGTCDFSSVAEYFEDASAVSDSILMVVMASTSMEAKLPPAETKPIIKLIIKGLKEQFPAIKYIEGFNEPDHKFGQPGIIPPNGLYAYYVPIYEAVNEVNEELQPAVPLKLGGPAFSGFNHTWMNAFFDGYAADPNPDKRLDFISWHGYGHFDDNWSFHMYKEDPSEVSTHRAQLDQMLSSRGLSTDVPAYITETGIYPGPSFDDPTGRTDYVRGAAGTAALHYWYSSQPKVHPFNWVVRHGSDERKDQLVTRVVPWGPLGLAASLGYLLPVDVPSVDIRPPSALIPPPTFTPYGNSMVMQTKMKATKVTATSDALTAGKGVYAIGSKDATGAAVMVWNYQGLGASAFRTAVEMTNLPPELSGHAVRERIFRIDETTSNYFTNPAAADLQQVSERVVTPDGGYATTLDLDANALYLILLEPA